ncbi:MAG: Dabb family protein [Parabacteroides merdae]
MGNGLAVPVKGSQQGLTRNCFFPTFHSDADRDAYLIHPAHKAFGKVLGDKACAVTVVDYWTK